MWLISAAWVYLGLQYFFNGGCSIAGVFMPYKSLPVGTIPLCPFICLFTRHLVPKSPISYFNSQPCCLQLVMSPYIWPWFPLLFPQVDDEVYYKSSAPCENFPYHCQEWPPPRWWEKVVMWQLSSFEFVHMLSSTISEQSLASSSLSWS